MDSVDQPEYERQLAELRGALGEEVFAAAWTEGTTLSLEQAVAEALAGPRRPTENGSAASGQPAGEDFGGLTARERQVAGLIAQGQSNRQIAETMVVGVRTAETYVTRILNKLDLDLRVQIATWAIEKGLPPPPSR